MKRNSLYSQQHAVLISFLRELRVVRELRQADVALAIDRPQTYLSDVEKGKRGLDLLQVMELCDAYDVSFPEFAKEFDKRLKKAGVKPTKKVSRS
ncbi:helix-turn-helix transcriptional regulator [Oleiagrimonas sp. MCCC 1A03011]|uniref:helix-turn-helix domain-containing protein n=1 Tax=Oleiagrimonas sp. MCCC 1A03011 TaxID=1926883 RepID=UPI000DC52FB4|nr:helix-turn-helix transcriptional regulator [Oleiagrimonas sp. MCCC 1A03011]RAP59664.1 hypothetical protein BTJ49_03215 [Oleiagrimonas sp. MCCC 1A03011]